MRAQGKVVSSSNASGEGELQPSPPAPDAAPQSPGDQEMWVRVKPLVVGFAAAMAAFGACFIIAQIILASVFPESLSRIGMEVYLVGAAPMLFVPAFAAGFFAKRFGAMYGVVLAGIPIAFVSMVNVGVPSAFYLMWLAMAAVGGHVGQVVAARKHAP